MKEKGSVKIIAIILYLTITILLVLTIILGVHIYKVQFKEVKEEIDFIDSFDENKIINYKTVE